MDDRNPRAMGAFRADVARRYDAAPAKVFAAWTDATRAKAWLASGGDLVMNPVAGGLFYIGMTRPAGTYPHYGRYLRVERDRKLEFTWVSEHTRGMETVVTISFEPAGNGTQVKIAHEGLPDAEMAEAHFEGWTGILEPLAQAVERLAA